MKEKGVVSLEKLNNENATATLNIKTALRIEDVQLLLNYGMEAAKVNEMITLAKREYVMKHHNRKIFPLPPSQSWKNGGWKTFVYKDEKRKEITAATQEKLIEKLYVFYLESEEKSLEQVFEMLMDYKRTCLNRSEKTINIDRDRFEQVPEKIRLSDINKITDDDIRKYIVSVMLPKSPKPATLKRTIQLLRAVFDYGIKKKICSDNPMRYIEAQDYYKYCDQTVKADEEKAFSTEELAKLSADAEKHLDNPRVLMSLLAQETGMRIGELTALHKEDIQTDYIHVHRQQVKNGNKIAEVPYTKDERLHPHNGRYIPLTEEAKRVIRLAMALSGDSPYLFHESNKSGMIPKDGYVQNLRRRCKQLGCVATNNHAFRMAFNSRLIEMGFSASDRALILGHEVQTNEAHYSLTDKRRLEDIKNRISKEEP